ncbi:hypothetical protein HF521_019620 [Silurus meridionalis]|uniref:Uncharacterized protein n=2 Tax=Silurus meridionalis TaxID=175797 RepID=A0A8T0BLN0_SILME|nr:hypothetical protein HF521_019620 [Silurus meridionalis]
MEEHFKDLTGIPLIETFLNSIDRKGNRLLNFMRNVCATKNKHVLQAITKLKVLRGQTNGCPYDVKDTFLLLVRGERGAPSSLCRRDEPRKGCRVGKPACDALRYCVWTLLLCCCSLSVDRKIVNDDITTFIAAVCLMFRSYYCFNIHYPTELASVLEFLQRCFFIINPKKDTKVVEKNNERLPVNPRVFTLISDLSDHE